MLARMDGLIDEVLRFWFGDAPATTTEDYGKQMKRWFMGGAALDAEIQQRFGALVERALAGELEGWARTPRGRLALILLLDQFTRSIYRDDPRTYAGDAAAQRLAAAALDGDDARQLPVHERHFLIMPFIHAEDLAMQERGVAEMAKLVAEAAPFQRPVLAMGTEQTAKYREIIARFGRFPHRNAILGRTSTPDEVTFLADWESKKRPKGLESQ